MAFDIKPRDTGTEERPEYGGFDPETLLKLWKKCKKESFDGFWVYERQWIRNILYVLGRQWIFFDSAGRGEWKDKRLAKWIPKPVTNKCKEAIQSFRSMVTAIKLGVNIRPNGASPENVSAAATADDLAPLLHEEHELDAFYTEADWWLPVTGNVFSHTYWDQDIKHGTMDAPVMQCGCPEPIVAPEEEVCPTCGMPYQPLVDEDGQPVTQQLPKGKGVTIPLSPLEIAFPNSYPRFEEVPYVIRRRWRTRDYFENDAELKPQVKNVRWQKSPNDRSLQIFKAMPTQNDVGTNPGNLGFGGGGNQEEEGAAEYELWYKPCADYPEGLVMRVLDAGGDELILEMPSEGLPGPIPYTDSEDRPLFTFSHAVYEHVGGRVLGSGMLDPIIQKQDQLNQLDSMIQMIIMRMSNPIWLEPKGAEVEKFTGEPGLVVKWNPLTVGGNAKPERIEGIGPHGSFFTIREMYLKDIEDLTGTHDIIKGSKPTGVEAFSALQLLDERAKSRFASVLNARGKMYRDIIGFALELERKFGPELKTKSILTPNRGYTLKTFKMAELRGALRVVVEDGSAAPKTALGMRAALEHANQLGLLNMQDTDTQYAALSLMGLSKMVPSLDVHMQAALQKQQAFEEWLGNEQAQMQSQQQAQVAMQGYQQQVAGADEMTGIPQPPSVSSFTPLKWLPWYSPAIHKQEFLKWANSDRMRELLVQYPNAEQILTAHLMEIDMALMQAQAVAQGGQQGESGQQPGGGGAAMNNSNRESGNPADVPKGNKEGAQGRGPE